MILTYFQKTIICLLTKTERDFSKVRDLLLWQDVYVWEGLGGAGGVSSSQVGKQSLSQKSLDLITPWKAFFMLHNQGSREGSESGEGVLADEIDKLQVCCLAQMVAQIETEMSNVVCLIKLHLTFLRMETLPLVGDSPMLKLGKSHICLLLGLRHHRFLEVHIAISNVEIMHTRARLFLTTFLDSGFSFTSPGKTSKCDWEQHRYSRARGLRARRSRKVSASWKSSCELDSWWFWHRCCQWCQWNPSSTKSLSVTSFAPEQVGIKHICDSYPLMVHLLFADCLRNQWHSPHVQTGLLNPWTAMAWLLTMTRSVNSSWHFLLKKAINLFVSRCNEGWLRFSRNTGQRYKNYLEFLVAGLESLLCQVTQLRRDLTLSRLALQQVDLNLIHKCILNFFFAKVLWAWDNITVCCCQAGLQPVELGSGGEEEAALEAASGVESTNSEVRRIMSSWKNFKIIHNY